MKKLLLNESFINETEISKEAARKLNIAFSSFTFLIKKDSRFKEFEWAKISASKEIFVKTLNKIGEITKLEIFKDNDLNEYISKLDEKNFEKFMELYNSIDFSEYDEVKFVKELRNTGKLKKNYGEFITDDKVIEIAVKALEVKDNCEIIDSFNGESGVLTSICDVIKEQSLAPSTINFYGQEIDEDVFKIGQVFGYIILKDNFKLILGNSIEKPAFTDGSQLKKFEYAISCPPIVKTGASDYVDKYNRFSYFRNKKLNYNNSSWLMAEHVIATIKDDGKGAVLLPLGALFRSSINDVTVKKSLIDNDLIEGIIKLPAGILGSTGINVCWVIINKNKESRRKGKVQFIDLSDNIETIGRRDKVIPEECVNNALYEYKIFIESDNSSIIDKDILEENNYNLDLFGYKEREKLLENINEKHSVRLGDIADIKRGVQISKNRLAAVEKENEKTHYLLSLGNIVDGKIKFSEEDKIAPEERWINLYEVKEGDILLTSKGSAFKIALVDGTVKNAILSSNLLLIRLNKKKYKPEVLKYFFESEIGRNLLNTIITGAVVKSISNKALEDLLVPDVDINKQEKIAKKIIEAKEEYEAQINKAEQEYKEKKDSIDKMINY